MAKPTTSTGYSEKYTAECERILVALLRGLGPWKRSVYLIGGLTPRYLVPASPSRTPAHAGTIDVDIVVDFQMLVDTEAYHTLEENLKRLGFERAENEKKQKLSWRWQTRAESGALIVLELLADVPEISGGKVRPLPTDGNISALNIPHASIVFDWHAVTEVQAELPDGNGIAIERVRHADIVSFTCLKSLAFDDRAERKDAHDLIYSLQYIPGGIEAAGTAFHAALATGRHRAVLHETLEILRRRFASDDQVEGYRKDGPIAVAKFELGEGTEPGDREARIVRQRQVSSTIERLLAIAQTP